MVLVDPDDLEAFGRDLLAAEGIPRETAAAVAESLVMADLRDHASHGVLRIPYYFRLLHDPIRPEARPEVSREDATTASIDGAHAFGQVVGREMVDLLVGKARESGVAAVGLRRSAHLGRVGEWAERAAAEGVVCGGFVKSRSPKVAPAGSADRVLSTNPITWSVPTFGALDFDVVLDMATSQVAHGKIRDRAEADEPLPEGWTITASGEPILDARAFSWEGEGALWPLGGEVSGYKGFGLSAVAELLAGVFSGAPVAGEHDEPEGYNDALFVAVDPLRFTTEGRVREQIGAFADRLRAADYPEAVSAGVAAGDDEALLPGEPEHRAMERALREGVDLSDAVARNLRDLAAERGIDDAVPPAIASL